MADHALEAYESVLSVAKSEAGASPPSLPER
jgi:hypothetical protein